MVFSRVVAARWVVVLGGAMGLIAGCKSKDTSGSSGEAPSASGQEAPAAKASGATLAAGFEGEVDFVYTAKEDPGAAPVPATILVKGSKARVNIPPELAKAASSPFAAGAYVILDGDAKKLYAVLDARKEVVVLDLNRAGEDMKSLPPSQPGEHGDSQRPPTKITRTGQYDTVAGYKCENWIVTSDHKEATLCVAEQGFSWFNFPASGMPGDRQWASELLDGKHFPLRFVAYETDGATEKSKVEITKLEKKDVPDAELQYPPTYTVMDMASMMRAFGGMGAMGAMPGRGMPPGMQLPPGVHLPPGVQLPPGMTMPPPRAKTAN
jgi:hypothetical protein